MWACLKSIFQFDVTTPVEHRGVERQTEHSHTAGTVWDAVLNADCEALDGLIDEYGVDDVLELRGPVGETPLHMCLIYNTEDHKDLARHILDLKPDAVRQVYEGAEYRGENCLHIAVVNEDVEMVAFLLEKEPCLLLGRATGKFFEYGKPCYYGEFPICFAACTNQQVMVELLLAGGADIAVTDSNGNTLLHLLVVHNLKGMYDFVLSREAIYGFGADEAALEANKFSFHEPPLNEDYVSLSKRCNKHGLTPFTLAAFIGAKSMFEHMLEERKERQWAYGPVTCHIFPLEELDSRAVPVPSENGHRRKSAIEHIVEQEHVDLLMLPRVVVLLRKKWAAFAERMFLQRLVFTFLYLVLFTVMIIFRTDKHNLTAAEATPESLPTLVAFRLSEAIVRLGAAYKLFRELREMVQDGISGYFSTSGSAMLENLLSLGYCGCVAADCLFGWLGSKYEDAFLALSAVFGWSYMLFFLLGFRLTGPLVVMIYKMLIADFVRFIAIFMAFLLGFSEAFYIIFNENGILAFAERLKICFMTMLGGLDFDSFIATRFPLLSVGLFVLYVVVVAILLLNLLIAMMGDTYTRITEAADKEWHLEWARIIFSIESEMGEHAREHPANCYWTTIAGQRYLQVEDVQAEREHFAGTSPKPTQTPEDRPPTTLEQYYGAPPRPPRAGLERISHPSMLNVRAMARSHTGVHSSRITPPRSPVLAPRSPFMESLGAWTSATSLSWPRVLSTNQRTCSSENNPVERRGRGGDGARGDPSLRQLVEEVESLRLMMSELKAILLAPPRSRLGAAASDFASPPYLLVANASRSPNVPAVEPTDFDPEKGGSCGDAIASSVPAHTPRRSLRLSQRQTQRHETQSGAAEVMKCK